ncbi:DUF1043 family protein [Amphritea sp. 2_MG-2023]|uniref:YhcB family protein n=1 Tax=Amphritea TaxID=515417 RepID=UPI001C068E48|nr:DUF1043 family protein [Amphritea sp. 2_MG-2023]MBU2966106.1 YhcB family protein [Amphritea atlantica]MDO6418239.1 DUF1043 family protein [Amphritea sp. 2_MG-2023]
MEENSVWIIGIVTLLAGALIGYLMGRSGDTSSQKKLTSQLNEAQRDLSDYKEKVNGHFEKTAELVNNLTESYKQVHQHLAQGSETLCMGVHSPDKLSSDGKPQIEEQPLAEAVETKADIEPAATVTEPVVDEPEVVEPPRDYAPKKPDEEGMLSDKYGLKKRSDSEEDELEDVIPPILKDQIPHTGASNKETKPLA